MTGKRFPDFGKRFAISENAEDFATHMVISDISTNLSFLGISSKFWRIGRRGRKTFPSGRETLRKAGKRFPDFWKRVPISGNAAEFAPRVVISDIPTNLSFYGIRSKFWRIGRLGRETLTYGRKTLRTAGKCFPDFGKRFQVSENAGGFATKRVISHISANLSF